MKANRHRGVPRRRAARRFRMWGAGAASLLFLAGCNVGPKYHKPAVETPSAYKEIGDWKVAEPKDETARGKWWEIFGDPRLNELEEQVNVSNQNIAAAAANFLVARGVVKQARSQYFPVVSVNPAITNLRGDPGLEAQPVLYRRGRSPSIRCPLMHRGNRTFGGGYVRMCRPMSTPRKRSRPTLKMCA